MCLDLNSGVAAVTWCFQQVICSVEGFLTGHFSFALPGGRSVRPPAAGFKQQPRRTTSCSIKILLFELAGCPYCAEKPAVSRHQFRGDLSKPASRGLKAARIAPKNLRFPGINSGVIFQNRLRAV